MSRYSGTWIVIIFLLFACNSTSEREKPVTSEKTSIESHTTDSRTDSTRLIIPGERLGHIFIGENAENLDSVLGKPDLSDAAMGKAWLTWNGNPDNEGNLSRLDIYTHIRTVRCEKKQYNKCELRLLFFPQHQG